jgi:hypothetical protein
MSEFGDSVTAPDSIFLPGGDGVVTAEGADRTICTKGFGSLDCLFSDFPVWDVLREKHLGQVLTGDTAGVVNGEQ